MPQFIGTKINHLFVDAKERLFGVQSKHLRLIGSTLVTMLTTSIQNNVDKPAVNNNQYHYLAYNATLVMMLGGGRCHNLKNDKEASEVTEGKSSRMRWGR